MAEIHQIITRKETAIVRYLAQKVYREFCPAGEGGQIKENDLFHCGIQGLLEARRSFDGSRGIPLLAFAARRIRGAMIDSIRKLPIIRLPQEQQQKVKELEQAKFEISRSGGAPDVNALAEKLGWPTTKVHKVMGLSPSLVPVAGTDSSGAGAGAVPVGTVLVDQRPGPEMAIMKKELAELIRKCLEIIKNKSRLVLMARYFEELTLREIAATLGCSIEKVRLDQKKAEKKMKTCLEDQGWTGEGLDEIVRC